jgi:hypothetical protein
MTGAAHDLQSTDHAPAVQIAVVQFVLLDDIALQPIQVFFGEKLASEETGTAYAFEVTACGARRQRAALFRLPRARGIRRLIEVIAHVLSPTVIPRVFVNPG